MRGKRSFCPCPLGTRHGDGVGVALLSGVRRGAMQSAAPAWGLPTDVLSCSVMSLPLAVRADVARRAKTHPQQKRRCNYNTIIDSFPERRLTSQFRNGSLIRWKMSYTLEISVADIQSLKNFVVLLLSINIYMVSRGSASSWPCHMRRINVISCL